MLAPSEKAFFEKMLKYIWQKQTPYTFKVYLGYALN